ncbi:uncharacterized protein HKW66_Vig0182820 [Vigna angularis]|uniref:Uncharacterized protein n=1 Tax=Phaseolus angularis TaxID=3914 RepID=A0A8T0K3Z4_PHAAN|nr:uncharacterized protein HKW66_Vig0182820 [Vigna angularis]
MEALEYFVGGYFADGGADQFSQQDKRHAEQKIDESFAIDDLLDFSYADDIMSNDFFDNVAGNSTDSFTVTALTIATPQFRVATTASSQPLSLAATPVILNALENSVLHYYPGRYIHRLWRKTADARVLILHRHAIVVRF